MMDRDEWAKRYWPKPRTVLIVITDTRLVQELLDDAAQRADAEKLRHAPLTDTQIAAMCDAWREHRHSDARTRCEAVRRAMENP